MNNNIDIKTLEAFQDGNHKAFETIFIAYYNKTKTFIDGYIKSEPDAEELTEDLFVNLWINRHSIDTSRSFNSYLHTIARNAAINFLKHKYVCDAYLNNNQETGYSSTSDYSIIFFFILLYKKTSTFLLSFLPLNCIYSKVQQK